MSSYAFIFPGQGSQYPGMGKDLVENFPVAREIFAEADDTLGFKLSTLCFEGPEADLKLTANTQPAILTASIAAYRVLQTEASVNPLFMAGHSLGEYSALVASGAMKFGDAVKTVRLRGTYMQEAVPVGVGAMAAILGVGADILKDICAEAAQGEIVAPANYNSPGQIVIAGNTGAVERTIALCKEKGYKKAMLLPVSAPFHCSLMQPAGERLAHDLAAIGYETPIVPIITNVEALPNSDVTRIRELLVKQVSSPVLWDASVRKMVEIGVQKFVEIGPGKVLSGLVKRIDKGVATVNIEDTAGLQAVLQEGI